MAIKIDGNVCVINGLKIVSDDPARGDTIIPVDDPRFKIFCPAGTLHSFETLPDGKINLL